jgi:YD repeat-containing protein
VSAIRWPRSSRRSAHAVPAYIAAAACALTLVLIGLGEAPTAGAASPPITSTSGLGTRGPGPTVPTGAASITGLWTANSRTFKDRPDGPYTTILYTQPINVKGPEDAWRPIEGTTIPGEPASTNPASAPHIDASTTINPSQDCPIESNHATESLCSSTSDKVGWDTVDTDNTLIQFNIKEALSPDANVLNAQFGMYLSGSSTSNAVSVSAYALLKPWTTSATWNTYDGTHAWTEAGAEKAGSDYTTTNTVLNPSVVAPAGWAHWYPTQIVQEWANGTLENHGLLLADTTQRRTNDALTFNSSKASSNKPYLTISWTPRGQEDPPAYTMQPFPIDETSTMKVNLASGDLFVNSNDLSVTPKAGPPLLAEHNYDSRNTEGGTVNPWYSLPGASVYADGSVAIGINRYDFEPFIRQSNGTFLTPRGIHATLCEINETTCKRNSVDVPNKGKYALTFNENGTTLFYREGYKIDFGENGGIWSIADPEGHAIVWNYEGKLKLKDSEGHTFTRNTTEAGGFTVTSSWTESGGTGREVKYAYNSSGKLETYTDAEGHKTKYVYDTDGELSEITAPSGTVTKLHYAADTSRRITKIEGAEEDGSKGTWEYTYYEVGKAPAPCTASQKATVVTETNGNEEPPITYCANVWDEIEQVSGYPATGQAGWYMSQDEALSESVTASVTLSSGNLLVKSEDVTPEEEDKKMSVARFYNSQATQSHSTLGSRWRWGTGPSVYLVDYGSMVAVHGPSGYTSLLNRTPTETYTAPAEYEGTLTKSANGTYTLVDENNPTYQFNGSGVLTSETTEEGNAFNIADSVLSGKSVLHTLSPTSGKSFEAKYDSTPHVTETSDPASHTRHYEYDSFGRLKVYIDASGGKTEYEYESANNLSKITMPDGTVEQISYSGGKVSEVSTTPPGGEASGQKFSYQSPTAPCNPATDAGETVVMQVPSGEAETYCYDALGHRTGPKTEGQELEEEIGETPEEIAGGTCYKDSEIKFEDCTLEEPEPENPVPIDLPSADYGLADSNWLFERTKAQIEEGVEPHAFFNYFESKPMQELHAAIVRRTVPWNMVSEAEIDKEEVAKGKKGGNPGAVAKLEDVKKWITLATENHAEPYISFDDLCGAPNPEKPTEGQWDDPREHLSAAEEEVDDHPCKLPPDPEQYEAAVKRFVDPTSENAVLSEVHFFTALNEPNLKSEVCNAKKECAFKKPTWNPVEPAYAFGPTGAHLAGDYWRVLDHLCQTKATEKCEVAAGDFSDVTNMSKPFNGTKNKTFEKEHNYEYSTKTGYKYFWEYVAGTGRPTTLMRWAFHTYKEGAETEKTFKGGSPKKWWATFRNFVQAIDFAMRNAKCAKCKKPDVWLSEQGVVYFESNKMTPAEVWQSKGNAKEVMKAFVKHGAQQASRQPQVVRFFYYNSRGEPGFDSGLLEAAELPAGLPKPFNKFKYTSSTPRAEIYGIYKSRTLKGG